MGQGPRAKGHGPKGQGPYGPRAKGHGPKGQGPGALRATGQGPRGLGQGPRSQKIDKIIKKYSFWRFIHPFYVTMHGKSI